MFSFMAHLPADTPGISNIFLNALGVSLLAKTIGKVKRVKVFSGKKTQSHNAIAQKGSPDTVIVNERNVLNIPAPLRDGAVINDKITLFERFLFELEIF